MITLSDNIYASLPLPGDAKNINTVLDNNNVIVETIQQYLNRVDMYSRYLGMEVPILIPEGIYEANDFVTKVNSGIITWSKYGFVEGVEDPDFIPILNGLQELPTEEYFPVTIDPGSQTILAITADQILSITLPTVHDAVTIATGSETILGLNNQELSISLPDTTVTSGAGMDFTGTEVILGTPSSVDYTTLDEVTATSHTHSVGVISTDNVYKINTYGPLYNWFVTQGTGANSITSSDAWKVPSDADWTTLTDYLGSDACQKLCESGTVHWEAPNSDSNNISGFSALGNGIRDVGETSESVFIQLKQSANFWSTTDGAYSEAGFNYQWCRSIMPVYLLVQRIRAVEQSGYGIRLLKVSTTLNDGDYVSNAYTDNDGNRYDSICIGTQEWLTKNLIDTSYRNTTTIPEVQDPTAWKALTTGAMCYYNNINILSLPDIIDALQLKSHDPVTIDPASADYASIDTNQVITLPLGSISLKTFWSGTLSAYNAIDPKDSNTIYFIEE